MSSRLQTFPGLRKRGSYPLPASLAMILVLQLCFLGCGKDAFKTLGELAQIRNDLIREFHEENIDVILQNSNNLAVTFINSPLNAHPDQLFERAQETAVFIRRRYAGIDRLESILVRFFKHEKRMLVVDYTEEIESFVFGKDAVLIGAPPEMRADAFKDEDDVIVSYNAARNESDVQIVRLDLEGNMEKGLFLSPHFKVRGDASIAGHTIGIPSAVIFNFASFAPDKVFKDDPALKIVADGIPVFNDKAHNMSTTTAGGNEFLVQAIPLDQFLKMTAANTVILTLGSKEFLLSDSQIRALRDMAVYANSGRKR